MANNKSRQTKKNRHSEPGGCFTARLNQIKQQLRQQLCELAAFL
jgi:hypothetical protein